MSVWNTFLSWFNRDTNTLSLSTHVCELVTEAYFKELAIQACVNLIANTVARSEFKTFEQGVETRRDNHYLFNVEPNPNKSASKFWRDVIHKLVYNNQCLVIQQNDYFYVADTFTVKPFAFLEYLYSDIVIGDLTLRNTYTESQVLHFELHNKPIRAVIEGLYRSYAKLIAASQEHYKRNQARRGVFNIPASYNQTEKGQKELEDLFQNKFRRFFEAEGGAVLPLTGEMKYTELPNQPSAKGSIEGRDIRSFIDDVFDFVAIAFQVPPQLLKGNVADTEKAMDNFLTFCINPLAELLTDEINRKIYGKKHYLERTYMKLDTSHIRAVDIKDVANAFDVLIRCGCYCVDDCLATLGMEPLNTEWSRRRWMTKNYEPIERRLEGGGDN